MIVSIGKHTITIDSWNDLTPGQLIAFCKLSMHESNPARLKVKLLLNFCDLKLIRKRMVKGIGYDYQWFRHQGKRILLSTEVINAITESIIAIFYRKTEEGNYSVDPDLHRNLILPFRVGMRKYCGPADGLTNISFKEFILAETYYSKYIETQKERFLNGLVATLFRPKKLINIKSRKYTGDERIRFNDYLIEHDAAKLQKLNPAVKHAIRYFYIGCRRMLCQLYPHVFSSGGGSVSDTDTFNMYLDLVDTLANNDPTRKELIRDQPLHEVLNSLNNIAANAKRKK